MSSYFPYTLNYSVKWLDWIYLGPDIQNETGTSVPDFMNDKAILIFAEDLPVLEDGYEAEAMYPLVEGGAIWNASITIAFIAPRCEENHMLSSCFHVYPSHSLLFSNSFSKFICQCYSKNCLLPIIVIMNSNNWCLLFV